jgi:hypothetical protein
MGQYRWDFRLPCRVDHVELEKITMQKQTPSSNQKSTRWKFFLSFNIVVLFFFWFGVLTDYSWYDNWVSFSYSVFVLCASVIIFEMLRFLNIFQRVLVFLVCLLSFFMALVSIPLHRYHAHPVQVKLSPDGSRFIEVYCSFTDAHVTGFDHIEIFVRNKKIPFLQRDLGLYNNYSPRHCLGDMSSLVHWKDNNTIYVVERKSYLHVDYIKWDGFLTNPGEINGNN